MQSFKELLTELFDKPFNWKWASSTKHNRIKATFDANGTPMVIEFAYRPYGDDERYMLQFGVNKGGLDAEIELEQYDANKIMATVIDVIKEFINEYKPDSIKFEGEKSIMSIDRSSFYKKVIKKNLPSNYEVEMTDNETSTKFLIKVKD